MNKEDKLYIVEDRHNNVLLGVVTKQGVLIGAEPVGTVKHLTRNYTVGTEVSLLLTEKQIKDFDKNYWAFAKFVKYK